MRISPRRWSRLAILAFLLTSCGGSPEGAPVRFTVPPGSGMGAVTDTLAAREIIGNPLLFRLYARWKGAERGIKPGTYAMQRGTSWDAVLDKLVSGDVLTLAVAVPEGWTIEQIGARLSEATGIPRDSVRNLLSDSALVAAADVPGPTLEGYLYPATYTFPVGTSIRDMVRTMTERYKRVWTPELRARADSMGMSEREVVTLASIIEKEAKVWQERETISAVYQNRLRIGMPLQADPTVQYARGMHESRLLYSHIEAVRDHPYNTYTQKGLPPGPIASPSKGAIEAALNPAEVDYLYFVARPDGTHVFTRTLAEHNTAKQRAQRQRAEAAVGR
jgi:UPF0755 protein